MFTLPNSATTLVLNCYNINDVTQGNSGNSHNSGTNYHIMSSDLLLMIMMRKRMLRRMRGKGTFHQWTLYQVEKALGQMFVFVGPRYPWSDMWVLTPDL